jgi:hypothetical protein
MTMFSEPWNNSADRFESHIIHYAGSGVFDSRVSNKVEQMKLDYKRIYNSRTKILFVGVFDTNKKSTNTSQLIALKREGYNVIGYNYRKKAAEIGPSNRDKDLVSVIGSGSYDLVVYSKCNNVSEDVFVESRKYSKTCLWFMDPLATYDEEMRRKTSLVDYFCCDKENVLSSAKEINPFSYHIHEGFDEDVDRPHDLEKEYDLSFIGSVYGQRSDQLKQIAQDVKIINNAYGADHAKEVSKTRINLNFCTDEGASDRVYKVLAARGFLISDDWHNRDKYLTNGEDCVIFKDVGDLNNKIKYYLQNPELMEDIANNGFEKVQQFNRINWAKRIVELSSEC